MAHTFKKVFEHPWFHPGTHLLFWVGLYLMYVSMVSNFVPVYRAMLFALQPLALLTALAYFNAYFLIPRFFQRGKVFYYALAGVGVFVFVSLIMLFVAIPLDEFAGVSLVLIDSDTKEIIMRPSEQFRTMSAITSTFGILFISTIYTLARDQVRRERDRQLLKTEKVQSELKLLRLQINPHFLVNSLNNLYAISKLRPNELGAYIEKLTEMLNFVTYDCNGDRVPMNKELTYIRNYLYLQELKGSENRTLRFSENIQDPDYPIEPMILIPFIENAFKHSYSEKNEAVDIDIQIRQEGDRLWFSCSNSILERTLDAQPDPDYSGVGVDNVSRRLAYSYPHQHRLHIQEDDHLYTATLELYRA